jgi:hypothetical protein
VIIKIYDSNNVELHEGDFVKIRNFEQGGSEFFSKVQIKNGVIYPFCVFSCQNVEKVLEIPQECTHRPATDIDPEFWVHTGLYNELIEEDEFEKWRLDHCVFEMSSFYKIFSEDNKEVIS